MKATTLVAMSLCSIMGASAWKLDLSTPDGRTAHMHGTRDVACNDIAFTPALNVNRARFDPATPLFPDPGTFELYVNAGCRGLSYRNGGGTHGLSPRVVRSYKVY